MTKRITKEALIKVIQKHSTTLLKWVKKFQAGIIQKETNATKISQVKHNKKKPCFLARLFLINVG